jgi:hypothetical protein
VEKRAAEITTDESVFGTNVGELDPSAPEVPEEWWEILESIVDGEEEVPADTVSLRRRK